MSTLLLVFTPVAPPFSELTAALASFPGGLILPGSLFDDVTICALPRPAAGHGADRSGCVRLSPGLRNPRSEALRLAKHWPAGLAPEEVAVLRLEYDPETVELVGRVVAELAARYRFFVETKTGRLHSAERFARRSVRESGSWWEGKDARAATQPWGRTESPETIAQDIGGLALPSAAVTAASDETTPAGSFAPWRPLADWSPPGGLGEGHLAILAVASLPSGPTLELGGRLVPGLLGWFARRLRAWEGELRAREPDLLQRPAAYLFVAARAAGPDGGRGSERVAWYPGVVESVRGFGDATHGPGNWVDLRLGELLERAARMIEAG